jgi:hypothetical protein
VQALAFRFAAAPQVGNSKKRAAFAAAAHKERKGVAGFILR